MDLQDIYATRPIKIHGRYAVNLYRDKKLLVQIPFNTRKVARVFMSRYDNWDKLCARVPARKPVQGELELVA